MSNWDHSESELRTVSANERGPIDRELPHASWDDHVEGKEASALAYSKDKCKQCGERHELEPLVTASASSSNQMHSSMA